jgi:RND family efflux transporter MFP subunit
MLKVLFQVAIVGIVVLVSVPRLPSSSLEPSREVNKEQPKAAESGVSWINGRTQVAPGRKGTIAPAAQPHPVTDVLVKPGDRVKKDQVLVKLDDDEPQADVRNKKAIVDSAKVALDEAERYLKKAEDMYKNGVYPESRYFVAVTAALKAKHDEQAAVAAWEGAKAELEHYTVTSLVDGVICWLDVHPGMVSRPGTTVWGEILDLSEIDIRFDVTPEQADQIKTGQAVQIKQMKKNGSNLAAQVVLVGITVDAGTGLVSVIARVPNPDGVLRCGEAVQVGLREDAKEPRTK